MSLNDYAAAARDYGPREEPNYEVKLQLYVVVETYIDGGHMQSTRVVVRYLTGSSELDDYLKTHTSRLNQMRIFKAEELQAKLELTLKPI